MNPIIRAAVTHSRVVILLLVALLISGTQTYLSIPKESSPDVVVPIIYVRAHLDGISPEDAETMLVRPLEQELRSIERVKKMEGSAYESGGSVTLEFEAGFDPDQAILDVREAVDRAKSNLPQEADDPVVSEVNLSKFPVLVISLSGGMPERGLYSIADELSDAIEGLSQVLEVDVKGRRDEMVEIIVDPLTLESYGIRESDLYNSISRNNQLVAAGILDSGAGRFPIKVPGTINSAEELFNLPIKAADGRVVRFSDLTTVRRVFKDTDSVARVGGEPAVTLEVKKRSGENVIDTIDGIKRLVDERRDSWPTSLQVSYYGDASASVRGMLTDLQNNVLTAVLLVIIVVIAAMGVRTAGLVAIAIPGSFVIGILVIGLMGLTINMVVLFALIMAVGMLVDGAIVVGEYADRRMREGRSRKEAYIEAAQRMSWPIIASTATTLAAFLPLLWFPGIPGQFMKYLPITLIATLSASLLMALIFVPTLGGVFGKSAPQGEAAAYNLYHIEHGQLEAVSGPMGLYIRFMRWCTAHPISILLIVLAILYTSISLYGRYSRGVEFFPAIEPERAQVSIRARGDLAVAERDDIMREVEDKVLKLPEIRTVYASTRIGGGANRSGPEDLIGVVEMEFHDWDQRERRAQAVIEDLRAQVAELPGLIVEVQEMAEGPGGSDKPIQLAFVSDFPEQAIQSLLNVRAWMDEHGGFTDVEDSLPLPGIEWRVSVDREEAGRYGADVSLVGTFVQLITNGIKLSSYRPLDSDEELDIRVRFPPDKRHLNQLTRLRVPTSAGYVPISQFVTIEPGPKVSQISRLNSKRVYRLKAVAKPLPGEAYTNLGQLAASRLSTMREEIEALGVESGVQLKFEGQDEDQQEAQSFLVMAFAIAILLMCAILVAQFNSFYQMSLVLTAVILSLGGVFMALLLIGEAFSILMCGIGVVALAGIVVNNNIVLIDTFNEMRRNGHEVRDAAIRTAAQRLRPVLLTSITTVLGLLPMVLRLNIDLLGQVITYDAPSTQWWVQMAATLAGGMTFATILTLVLTPSLLMAHQIPVWWRRRKGIYEEPATPGHTIDDAPLRPEQGGGLSAG